MPGARIRARKRHARLAAILDQIEYVETFEQRFLVFEEVGRFLRDVAASNRPVWPFLEQIEDRYADDKYGQEERIVVHAMIADAVNPYLSGNTSGAMARRFYGMNRARKTRSGCYMPQC